MTTLSLIKSQVMYLFKTNPKVHIDISNKSDRKFLTNVPAVIFEYIYSEVKRKQYREKLYLSICRYTYTHYGDKRIE